MGRPWTNHNWWNYSSNGITVNAPKRSGVYAIGRGDRWIYIGEAGDIQARLMAHRARQTDQSTCISGKGADRFSYELWDSAHRGARETELIDMYDPDCNRT